MRHSSMLFIGNRILCDLFTEFTNKYVPQVSNGEAKTV
jgi:hypothetical protein